MVPMGSGNYMVSNSNRSNAWRDKAACRNEHWDWFFEGYENANEEDLKFVDDLCLGCPVQHECLLMGVATGGTGVHGGAYLSLGQLSKTRNAHRTAEKIKELNDQISLIKKQLREMD